MLFTIVDPSVKMNIDQRPAIFQVIEVMQKPLEHGKDDKSSSADMAVIDEKDRSIRGRNSKCSRRFAADECLGNLLPNHRRGD